MMKLIFFVRIGTYERYMGQEFPAGHYEIILMAGVRWISLCGASAPAE